jgi:two-component system nitrate/nitrite response regulator NarL
VPKLPPTEGNSSISVFVTEATRMGCQLMAAALQRSTYRLRVAGAATDSVGIHAGLLDNEAEVAVISARLKDGPVAGFDVTRDLRISLPKIGVIIMLDAIERAAVVEAFRAGARGVLSCDEPFELLCKCIHVVHQGQIWANSQELRYVLDALASTPRMDGINTKHLKGPNSLTKRELNVVSLVAEGLTNRDISQHLSLSEHTVRNYLFRIFNKLGTSNRLELAIYALNCKESAEGSIREELSRTEVARLKS